MGDEEYPDGVTAKMIDESQGVDEEPGWDPYDYPDDEDGDE